MAWFITGLRHEVIRLAKKHKRLQKHELLILNDLLSQDAEDEKTEILDRVATVCDILTAVEDLLFLRGALSLLTSKQQKVIKATILEDRTEEEVAAKLGISQPAVHQMKMRALKKLRKHFILNEPTAK